MSDQTVNETPKPATSSEKGEPMRHDKAIRLYIEHQRQRGTAPTTIRSIRYGLRALLDELPDRLERTTRRHLNRWYTRLDGSVGTRRLRVSQARSFGDWLVTQKVWRSNLIRDMGLEVRAERRKVPRRLTDDQIAALYRVLPDVRARMVITVLLHSGVRIGELVAVGLADIDWARGQMLVNGKTGQRWAALPDEARRSIDLYLASVGNPRTGPLVRSYNQPDRALTASGLSQQVSRWMADAGIKTRPFDGVSAHALRHTAATDVLERCGNIRTTQQFLGHVSVQSTEVYVAGAVSADVLAAAEGRRYAA